MSSVPDDLSARIHLSRISSEVWRSAWRPPRLIAFKRKMDDEVIQTRARSGAYRRRPSAAIDVAISRTLRLPVTTFRMNVWSCGRMQDSTPSVSLRCVEERATARSITA
jgi:hypothetical protein